MNKLLLLTFFTLFVSCGAVEEISEEIQNSNNVQNNVATNFTNKAIRLVHKMDARKSYIMHKAGSLNSPCELKAPSVGFSSGDYQRIDSNYALDCILDAEELDLYFDGASFEVQVDENLCEYVAYKPFGFMKLMPGNTMQKYYKTTCDEGCLAANPGNCDKTYKTFDSTGITVAAKLQDQQFDEPICHFDYSAEFSSSVKEYPNCDEGTMYFQEVQLTGVFDPDGDEDPSDSTCVAASLGDTTNNDCGGDHLSCVSGPVTEESDLDSSKGVNGVIYDNKELQSFTKQWSYNGSINREHQGSNRFIANFSRICSDTSTNKSLDTVFETLSFKGYEFETHRLDSAGLLTQTEDFNGDGLNDINAIAENPHRSSIATTPYYSVLCLDKAKDVKAQIRLFIRDWDRQIPTNNSYLARVSDVASAGTKYMDQRDALQDFTYPWNDYDDWDDFYEDRNVFTNNQCRATANPFSKTNFPEY